MKIKVLPIIYRTVFEGVVNGLEHISEQVEKLKAEDQTQSAQFPNMVAELITSSVLERLSQVIDLEEDQPVNPVNNTEDL